MFYFLFNAFVEVPTKAFSPCHAVFPASLFSVIARLATFDWFQLHGPDGHDQEQDNQDEQDEQDEQEDGEPTALAQRAVIYSLGYMYLYCVQPAECILREWDVRRRSEGIG